MGRVYIVSVMEKGMRENFKKGKKQGMENIIIKMELERLQNSIPCKLRS